MIDCILDDLYIILKRNKRTISTMESCTAGMLCSCLTDRCGASDIVYGGRITYNNKQKILAGVSESIIKQYGVYSERCALEMAKAIRAELNSSIGIGVTGTFGNLDKNNPDSEVGKVYYAIFSNNLSYSDSIIIPDRYIENRKMGKRFVADKILYKLPEFVKRNLEDK